MQTEPTNKSAHCLLELGVTSDQADKALLLLGADGAGADQVEERVAFLACLCRACGSLQNAKLAYSLALNSNQLLDMERCSLLAEAVRCSDCVPAGVRLWKTALEAEVLDPVCLSTAARLGADGAEQIRILHVLRQHRDRLPLAAELAGVLKAPGWEPEGSWGAICDPDRGLVWWDHGAPENRVAYGMTLSTRSISLKNRLGARFVFDVRHEILGTTDRCHLEVSHDGKRWEKVIKFEGHSSWKKIEVDLSKYGDRSVSLRFHVLSGGDRKGRGMEIAHPRIESHGATSHRSLRYEPLGPGWEQDGVDGSGSSILVGTQSEVQLHSQLFALDGLKSPTVALEAKVVASSVYAQATVEVIDQAGLTLAKATLSPTTEWQPLSLLLPESDSQEVSVKLWSRFSSRRERDGLWIRGLKLKGSQEATETQLLNGGVEDGSKEQKALLAVLESGTLAELERLVRLRRGLPNLACALALSKLVESDAQIPALLLLFSRLKEGAISAFQTLSELSRNEDPMLQSQVLLTSGTEHYATTRDHLGGGLLEREQYEENCRLYLRLRGTWSEEQARRGLSLLLTPVGAETNSERVQAFQQLLEDHAEPDQFFLAWDKHWALQ